MNGAPLSFKILLTATAWVLCLLPTTGHTAGSQVGFCDVTRRATRTPIDFKLARVEAYNRRAAQQGRPSIRYQAYKLGQPGCWQSMDFVFKGLTADQFRDVKRLYGDVGRSRPKRGRADYRLLDFMSPLIQALDGHVFRYTSQKVPQINAGRNGAYGTPNAPVDSNVTTCTNCWSTLYAVLKDLGNRTRSGSGSRRDYTLFYADRFQANKVLARLSDPVAKVKVKQADRVALPADKKMEFGDLLLVKKTRRQLRNVQLSARGTILSSTPGKMIRALEHAGFVVDKNLIFEKPDGGQDLPFRLVSLEDSVAPYRSRSQLEVEIRRRNGASIPHPRQAFGGTANAVEARYKKPLKGPLKNVLLLNKELQFPHEGEYYNNYNQLVDLGIQLNPRTQRYSLGSEAYQAGTYSRQLQPPLTASR
jgi:hypothetical protein